MQDYESDGLLSQYLMMHYGEPEVVMPWGVKMPGLDFLNRTVGYFSEGMVDLCLDVGCAVGRTSFLLTRSSGKVIGIDFSQSFVDGANAMKAKGEVGYRYQEEGANSAEGVARLPLDVVAERVSFAQGDAMNLPEGFKGFGRVHASNLLCRLPEPMRFLERLPSLVKDGGEVVLATPFSWLEEYTPKENWPEGDSWDWLCGAMGENFELVREGDEPFLIREHGRKFQLGVSRVSCWRRG